MSHVLSSDARRPAGPASPRVLILTADVGEGHIAAGRAISEGLEELGIRPSVCDGLEALGRLPRHVIRNGYRVQLRVAPATYNASYWIGAHVALVRMIGAWALSLAGRRGLRRLVRRHQPDVIVSTHPAITCVLGRMRLRRQLAVPVCATITDLADFAFWSHPGTDLHLVTHPCAIERVERFAGGGSAAHVGPIVSRRFLEIADPGEARRALGLPRDSRVIAVSGGGWGVGDLEGATQEALAAGATDVIVVTGRNETARAGLTRGFAGESRVHVWGFTDRMPDLLRAADAIVHSTGGVTSFEAIACGCPVVAYGSTLGHIRVHNRALAELGLAVVPDTREQLRDALAARLRAPHRQQPALLSCGDAPAVVASLHARVRPFGRWRIAAGRSAAVLSCVVALFGGMATDEAYSLAARPLDLRPGTSVQTSQRAVGLIVRVPNGDPRALATALAARDLHASFALRTLAAASTTRRLATLGDDSLPELGGVPAGWPRTHRELRSAVAVGRWRLYLASPELGLDEYMLAAGMHGRPIAGKVTIGTPAQALPPLSRGDLVVVTADGPPESSATRIAALAGRLAARGLSAESLSELASSSPTTERTAGDVMSTAAEQTTASSPMTTPQGAQRRMTPVLACDEWRHGDRRDHLHHKHDRRDLRRGAVLQGRHLAQLPDQGRHAGGRRPGERCEPVRRGDRVGDELGRQAAPGEREAGGQRRADGAVASRDVRGDRRKPHANEDDREHGIAGMMVGRGGRDERQPATPPTMPTMPTTSRRPTGSRSLW